MHLLSFVPVLKIFKEQILVLKIVMATMYVCMYATVQ